MKINAHLPTFIVSVGTPLTYASAAETEIESTCSRSNRYGIGIPRDTMEGDVYLFRACRLGNAQLV